MTENENIKVQMMPTIGDIAPSFRSMTTMGKLNFPDDYKGKWVVFFSHPADFTPVCTTEFIAFAKRYGEFKEINTELLGLSIDSLHSHIAWTENIEKIDLNGEGRVSIPFPIVADITMKVAGMYGMLQTVAKTQTVRAVFIIDPESIVRAILYYPMSTGRNIDEIKRVILSLQKHDIENISTPADWKPGDDVLMGSPLTLKDARERIQKDDERLRPYDWYLTAIKDEGLTLKYKNTKIWFEDADKNEKAYVIFPEYENGHVEVTHTVVDPSIQHRGIASKLIKAMADKLLSEGKKAELTCSYAVKWFNEHREYEDVLLNPLEEYKKAEEEGLSACNIPKH
ncbi:MAG: peroxiredoxin [Lachnospiraceae bacterium]|nr:peroxiredoxin [Lachnospiraceae bacterium]